MYVFSIWNDSYTYDVHITKVYREAFKYRDETGKSKQLCNWPTFKAIIHNSRLVTLNPNDFSILHFNFNLPLFRINGTKKEDYNKERIKEIRKDPYNVRQEYEEWSYKNIHNAFWEQLKLRKSIYDYKMFFFILSEIMRGPFQFIKTDVPTLKRRLMINDKNNKVVKMKIKKSLNYLKEIGFIKDYTHFKESITIEKLIY